MSTLFHLRAYRATCTALQGWKVKRLYHSRHQHTELEKLGVQHTPDWDTFLKSCDVVSCLLS